MEAGAEGQGGGVGRRALGGGCRSAQSRRGAGGVENQRRFFDYGASGEGSSTVAPSIARKQRGSRIAAVSIRSNARRASIYRRACSIQFLPAARPGLRVTSATAAAGPPASNNDPE